jgi:hypothetical protein
MLPHRSINPLYPLALAEGEGMGTAYEYYAKRLILARWLANRRPPRRLLIAGLPEKYGSSLDSFLLAQDLAVTEVVVIEDRPWALEKCRQSLAAAQATGQLTRILPQFVPVTEMGLTEPFTGEFDLCWSSEVLQRFDAVSRQRYVSCFANRVPLLALFVPNGDNSAHQRISGLVGLSLTELRTLIAPAGASATCGYVDMPPFPPGLKRSAAQRARAARGKLEAHAMWALGYYARLERFFPSRWRSLHSHIVYAFVGWPGTHGQRAEGS